MPYNARVPAEGSLLPSFNIRAQALIRLVMVVAEEMDACMWIVFDDIIHEEPLQSVKFGQFYAHSTKNNLMIIVVQFCGNFHRSEAVSTGNSMGLLWCRGSERVQQLLLLRAERMRLQWRRTVCFRPALIKKELG